MSAIGKCDCIYSEMKQLLEIQIQSNIDKNELLKFKLEREINNSDSEINEFKKDTLKIIDQYSLPMSRKMLEIVNAEKVCD